MLEDIFICKCEEKNCEYEFITNSTDYLDCPSCGSENIEGHLRKAHIFDSRLLTLALNKDDTLKNKVSEWLCQINNNISDYLSLQSFLNGWFESNSIVKPEAVSFDITTNFDSCEEGEDHFYGVSFQGSDLIDYDILEDLNDYIGTNYGVTALKKLENVYL